MPSPIVQVELIRRALSSIGCGERDLTSWHYEEILHLQNKLALKNSNYPAVS